MRSRTFAGVARWQLLGNAALALLFVAWLQIPDSHAWQFVLSMVMIAALIVAFLRLHAGGMRALHAPATLVALWQSCVTLAVWLLVWWGLVRLLMPWENNLDARAGYWNSQMSAHWRTTFSYTRLATWQHDALMVVLWWILPSLLLPLIVESVACGVRVLVQRRTYRAWRRWPVWAVVAVGAWVETYVLERLMAWQPGHSVRSELVSLALRLGVAYAIGVLTYCGVVWVVARELGRSESVQAL